MKNTRETKLFLLGGYDLEMTTIKHLLEGRNNYVVADRHLNWSNAQLSTYQQELNEYADCNIYGIELKEDIPLPPHYHRIDHHNDWNDKPSSLEQVAELFGVSLNWHQQLVAANDKGYIPGMKALGATEQEIEEIRRLDRAAQGVSEEEERLAEQSISKHLIKLDNLWIVYSFTSRFSAICDRLFPYRRLLVYTDAEWMFYGEGKAKLANLFEEDIKQSKMFHGGGENGYIGSVAHAFGKEEILVTVDKIKKIYESI